MVPCSFAHTPTQSLVRHDDVRYIITHERTYIHSNAQATKFDMKSKEKGEKIGMAMAAALTPTPAVAAGFSSASLEHGLLLL